jgi:hypothetical protein
MPGNVLWISGNREAIVTMSLLTETKHGLNHTNANWSHILEMNNHPPQAVEVVYMF